MIIIFNVVL
jgi:hypothetical protein